MGSQLKLVRTLYSKNKTRMTKVYYNQEGEEYTVKLYLEGTHYPDADYFTSDTVDAIQTALDMLTPCAQR